MTGKISAAKSEEQRDNVYERIEEGRALAPAPAAATEEEEEEVDSRSCSEKVTSRLESAGACGAFILEIGRQIAKYSQLLSYYALGVVAYYLFEGWNPGDSIYFITVTATTVGYGDLHPTSSLSKLFTIPYAVIGIVVVLNALSPLLALLKGNWREKLLETFGWRDTVDTEDSSLTIQEVNRLINYKRRYALALMGPTLVFSLGVLMHYTMIRETRRDPDAWYGFLDWVGLIDACYWAIITMTTIGYGDIHPVTPTAKLISNIYLPIGVLALADAVSDVQMIALRRSIRETDFAKLADECMLRDAVRGDQPNNNSVLTEAEFLVDQLTNYGLVDSAAVMVITRQFKHLTRRGKFTDENRRLTPKMVYDEIRSRAKNGKELSEGATVADLRDASFRWKSYEDWHGTSWESRVALAFEDKMAQKMEEHGGAQSQGSAPHLNSIVGSILSLPSLAKAILPDAWTRGPTPNPQGMV